MLQDTAFLITDLLLMAHGHHPQAPGWMPAWALFRDPLTHPVAKRKSLGFLAPLPTAEKFLWFVLPTNPPRRPVLGPAVPQCLWSTQSAEVAWGAHAAFETLP